MPWPQSYDPLHNVVLSTLVAGVPILVLLGSIAVWRLPAHYAALLGLGATAVVAVGVIGMPLHLAALASVYGAAYGLLPIGWIILNVIFLYRLTAERGLFDVLQRSLGRVTDDRRIQLVLIAFCFGSFFEGAAGFGTPVAITSALLIGLGFSALESAGLSLLANTAPVAFGAAGTPLVALAGVTGLPLRSLSGMVGHQLPFFSLIIPFWLVMAYAGFGATVSVWPVLLAAGIGFAVPQWIISNYHGPWLVDMIAATVSTVAVLIVLRVRSKGGVTAARDRDADRGAIVRAWTPWAILSIVVFLWGLPPIKAALDAVARPSLPIMGLDNVVLRTPPIVAQAKAESAILVVNWLSATGTGILVAALIAAVVMGYRPRAIVHAYARTVWAVRLSLVTIAAMLAIGYLTRYSGLDAILGLAFARTGVLYPFFGTMLGWLGVALTGSDTASNVLFGSLQRITAQQVGVSPILMAAANSSGGVMGKMIDVQSIVVASTTTRLFGQEWQILRFVFFHSVLLASLVGCLVTLQAYVAPLTGLVVR